MVRRISFGAFALGTGLALVAGLSGQPSMAQAQPATESPSAMQETYRDWMVNCVTPEPAEGQTATRQCETSQELSQTEGSQRVLRVALQSAPEGATLTLVTPFGLLISEPVTIDIAQSSMAEVPFRTCLPAGCIATSPIDQATVEQMEAGGEATVSMTSTNGQTLSVAVSLAGFSSAWARLVELSG